MDRVRRFIGFVQAKWKAIRVGRTVVEYVQYASLQWQNFVDRNWHNVPNGDYFRSLDILFALGAVRYRPTKTWQGVCWMVWKTAQCICYLFMLLIVSEVVFDNIEFEDVVWRLTVTSTAGICFLKDSVLRSFFEAVQEARNFINSEPCGSGDKQRDSNRRKKFFQNIQLKVLMLFVLILLDTVILSIPRIGIEVFPTPQIILPLGTTFVSAYRRVFSTLVVLTWFCKTLSGTGVICFLLSGFRNELEFFTCGFDNILNQVHSDVENNLPTSSTAASDGNQAQRDKLFWKYLKQHVNNYAKQHVELNEKLLLLKPLIRKLFFVIYYDSMALIAPTIYVVLLSRKTLKSLFLASGVFIFIVESYVWCTLLESLQDVNEELEINIMDLMAKIPHNPEHHRDYVEMRSTLFVMKTFVRNSAQFSCGGVFDISVEHFRNLCDITYSFATFLWDVGKVA